MESIQQIFDAFNASDENGPEESPVFSSFFLRSSVITSLGLPRQTLATKDRALARLFEDAAFEMGDQPDFVALGGTYAVQFYANDSECQAVIEAALRFVVQGGRA